VYIYHSLYLFLSLFFILSTILSVVLSIILSVILISLFGSSDPFWKNEDICYSFSPNTECVICLSLSVCLSSGSGGERIRPCEGLSDILLSDGVGSVSSHPQHLPVPLGEVQSSESHTLALLLLSFITLSISLFIPRNRFALPAPHYRLPYEEIPSHTHHSSTLLTNTSVWALFH